MVFRVLLGALCAAIAVPVAVCATPADTPAVLDDVAVHAPTSVPAWELRRGEDRLLILSDHYPRRATEDTSLDVDAVAQLATEAEALVYGPGVLVDDSVSLWRGAFMWRAYRQAMRLPDGGTLATVLEPSLYKQWATVKARYLPRSRSVEKLRPAYAAFELHKAAFEHHRIHQTASVRAALFDAFEDRENALIDARYRLDVDPDRKTVRAFEIDGESGIACLAETVARIQPVLDSSEEAADAWDSGDMDGLRAYFARTPPLRRCWEQLINQRTAELLGLPDPYAEADPHWVKRVEESFATRDTLITHLPARTVVTESGVIELLRQQGWTLRRLR